MSTDIEFGNKYNKFFSQCVEKIFLRPFYIGIYNSISDVYSMYGVDTDEKKTYNCIRAKIPLKLEKVSDKVFKARIPRLLDCYTGFQVNLFQNESIEKICINGKAQISDPIYTVAYTEMILEVTFSRVKTDFNRVVWVDAFLLDNQVRLQVEKIYNSIF